MMTGALAAEPDGTIRKLVASGLRDEAFAALLDAYEDRLLRLAYSILENRAAAEDAAQEALVRIWKALPRFRGDSALSTWVYSIARNAALTRLERERKHRAEPLSDVPAAAAPGVPDVTALLNSVPEKYRRVLRLYYFEEKSYEQVAEALGMPIGTVKTHLHRAKRVLIGKMREGRNEL